MFTVKLYLDNFFEDHRKKSLILITKKQKTINDVKNHISKIFTVDNFYLIGQEGFSLPDSEDVNILNHNDEVWVLPNSIGPHKKAKKSKKKREVEAPEQQVEAPEQQVEAPEPKSKKIKSKRKRVDEFEAVASPSKDVQPEKLNTVEALEVIVTRKAKKQRKEAFDAVVKQFEAIEREKADKSVLNLNNARDILPKNNFDRKPNVVENIIKTYENFKPNETVLASKGTFEASKEVVGALNLAVDASRGPVKASKGVVKASKGVVEASKGVVEASKGENKTSLKESINQSSLNNQKSSSYAKFNVLIKEAETSTPLQSKVKVLSSIITQKASSECKSEIEGLNDTVEVKSSKGTLEDSKGALNASKGTFSASKGAVKAVKKVTETSNGKIDERKGVGALNLAVEASNGALDASKETVEVITRIVDAPNGAIYERQKVVEAFKLAIEASMQAVDASHGILEVSKKVNAQNEVDQHSTVQVVETPKKTIKTFCDVEMMTDQVEQRPIIEKSLELSFNGSNQKQSDFQLDVEPSNKDVAESLTVEASTVKASTVETLTIEALTVETSAVESKYKNEAEPAAVKSGEVLMEDLKAPKRKRVRHRKKKIKEVQQQKQIPIVYPPRPLNIETKPVLHIKFTDDNEAIDVISGMDYTSVESNGERRSTTDSEPQFYHQNLDQDNHVVVISSDTNGSCNGTRNDIDLSKPISEELILKCPLMTDITPHERDVIVFKILKLNNNYCPVVSEYITGCIEAFDDVTKDLKLNILSGAEEFNEPQGFLSLNSVGNGHHIDKNQTLNWSKVLEPRLLSP